MKKGKAVRIYSINKEKLSEALDAIDEMVKPIKEALEKAQYSSRKLDGGIGNDANKCQP